MPDSSVEEELDQGVSFKVAMLCDVSQDCRQCAYLESEWLGIVIAWGCGSSDCRSMWLPDCRTTR